MARSGASRRERIVEAAAQIASHRGLKGTSLSRIAERAGLTKSGLVAHFPSKEELTLAVIDHAANVFGRQVLKGIDHSRPARERLLDMFERYRRYVVEETFEGGCLFLAMTVEIDDASPRERERITHYMTVWRDWVARVVRDGIARGELRPDTQPEGVAAAMLALCLGMGPVSRIFRAPEYFEHARAAAVRYLDGLAPGTP
ncbi:MAG: TetR family transcriptional regulator [Planctomycetota bacterium]|nr:MAG: TetR family transcriptional regulator [Planctomycetota bacterium]